MTGPDGKGEANRDQAKGEGPTPPKMPQRGDLLPLAPAQDGQFITRQAGDQRGDEKERQAQSGPFRDDVRPDEQRQVTEQRAQRHAQKTEGHGPVRVREVAVKNKSHGR